MVKPSPWPTSSESAFFVELYAELSRSLTRMTVRRTTIGIWYYQCLSARLGPWWSRKRRPEPFFVKYFEGNWVSSSSSENPVTAMDGWGTGQSRKYPQKKCWNTWTSWWRHFSWTLQVSPWKTDDPNAYFSLNTLQPFRSGIVLITSYSLSSMTNTHHVVFVHSLSVHGWRSLLQWYAGCFGEGFCSFVIII